MAPSLNKMAMTLVLVSIFQMICSHEEFLSSQSDSSDDMEEDPIRRTMSKNSDKYNSLNIDIPAEKNHQTSKIMTTRTTEPSTTTAMNPHILRRFRRIYNPDESASIDEYPFLAALLVNGKLWCGSAIIHDDTVLTAAHCLQLQYNNRFFREYMKMLTVRVGSSNATAGGELYRVTEIFFHPNYKPSTLEFNIALVKLHKNITYKADARADVIRFSRNNVVPTDTDITFLGWGSVWAEGGKGGEVLLQKVTLPIYDLFDCQDIYGRELVTRTNFCAGYITMLKNVCNHDAGGPAILDGVLVGILSFSSKRCDIPDQPAVFSHVGAVAGWLDSQISRQRT